jgi:hypothetical protein
MSANFWHATMVKLTRIDFTLCSVHVADIQPDFVIQLNYTFKQLLWYLFYATHLNLNPLSPPENIQTKIPWEKKKKE